MKTLTLHLNGIAPPDLSMKRLADYLCALAELYGDGGGIHFSSVTKGSARLNAQVDEAHHHKVLLRVREVANGIGPKGATKAYRRLAEYMLDDNVSGTLESEGCKVIQFPRVKNQNPLIVFKQGSVQGRLYAVGGKDDSVPVRIEGANGEAFLCETDVTTAASLAPMLFKQVRLYGKGEWERKQAGGWRLKKMRITSYEPLETSTLRDAIDRMKQEGGIHWGRMDTPHETISNERE